MVLQFHTHLQTCLKNHMAPDWLCSLTYTFLLVTVPSILLTAALFKDCSQTELSFCVGIQLFVSCEAFGNSLNLSDLQFPYLHNGDNNGVHYREAIIKLK